MSTKRFHLGWFLNFTSDEWNIPFGNDGTPWSGDFYVEMAKALERACFDYMMIEDKLMVSETYGGSSEAFLRQAIMAPKHDPAPLAALIGASTRNLGVIATLSTLGYHPYTLARLCSTIDSLSRGRFGWNIVTSAEDLAAQNYGLDVLPPRELRYEMAEEYVELVSQLFESWEPDAVVKNRETGVYADHTKVHPIHFKGKYFSCRGPLNTVRSPQGRPVYLQAGGSPRGKRFAAKWADSIIAVANGVEGMKQYRDDVRREAVAQGRDPDSIKVLFLTAPILGETEAEARAKNDRMVNDPAFLDMNLGLISSITDIDFAQFDLDQPLPKLTTNGEQGSLDKFCQFGSGKTLRQLVVEAAGGLASCVELIGTPDQVAKRMGEVMEEVGGDGFLMTSPTQKVGRRYYLEITDGLVPALQRRGLVRTEYKHTTLRENLREF
jgi:FMN-dependent oxidoreductase (nitrilotriacetate monooxygenase family)